MSTSSYNENFICRYFNTSSILPYLELSVTSHLRFVIVIELDQDHHLFLMRQYAGAVVLMASYHLYEFINDYS